LHIGFASAAGKGRYRNKSMILLDAKKLACRLLTHGYQSGLSPAAHARTIISTGKPPDAEFQNLAVRLGCAGVIDLRQPKHDQLGRTPWVREERFTGPRRWKVRPAVIDAVGDGDQRNFYGEGRRNALAMAHDQSS
jgi:hypothetical protein